MTHNEISGQIVDAAVRIHQALGPGLLESVYARVLEHELTKRGRNVQRELQVPVVWDGIVLESAFRADLLVENLVLVELKSVEQNAPIHRKQLLTYLKLTKLQLGLLINFGQPLLKDGIFRVVNGLAE